MTPFTHHGELRSDAEGQVIINYLKTVNYHRGFAIGYCLFSKNDLLLWSVIFHSYAAVFTLLYLRQTLETENELQPERKK